MVVCCVPDCGTDSWKCDGTITFYDFPSNPDLKAKWIKQINTIIKSSSLWFPRGRPVICSKHFLHTDFKNDADSLKPRSIPTVFGHKYIGQNPETTDGNPVQESNTKCSPVIVKVLKPQTACVKKTTAEVRISGACPQSNSLNNVETDSELQIKEINSTLIDNSLNKKIAFVNKNNLPSPIKLNNASSTRIVLKKPLSESTANKSAVSGVLQNTKYSLNPNSLLKRSLAKQTSVLPKKVAKKDSNSDLIEIGPNTFLKINPEVIKVNRKQTPSGNTVLQFVMDQKLAKNFNGDLIPKLVKNVPSSSVQGNYDAALDESFDTNKSTASSNQQNESVQHVLGHIVDNHVCEKSCVDLTLDDEESMDVSQTSEAHTNASPGETPSVAQGEKENAKDSAANGPNSSAKSFIEKAPVLLTTNMPLSHRFIDRPKYILQLKQKNRQLAALKLKLSTLNKKIEELEDRCIVQERQLSYSFIKRLKNIRRNAAKGDPCATYILEQIRSYSYVNNSKMRWSDSTLTQCAIWCRKAPYAYEYFKKAGFFKLPCLGTVKRFMKKHPEIKLQKNANKTTVEGDNNNDESSSDFDFDESDGQNENGMSEDENNESLSCETMLTGMTASPAVRNSSAGDQANKNNEIQAATESISVKSEKQNTQVTASDKTTCETTDALKNVDPNGMPVTLDTSNLELQEIILPSGEVVQCYSSNIVGGTESGQYFIIPNVGDQNNTSNHEYNVVQGESMPVILQNIENSQLHMQQDQLIFITNSSDQVECSETEVTSV